MRILAFETSAKAASVALLEEDRLVGEYYQNCGQTHSRTLMKMAQDLLDNCESGKPDAVACAAGPGSFTGVRIGVAAAKGYAWAAQLPCIGVSTLEAMAQQARSFEGLICCVMDARREQVYHARFSCHRGELRRLCEDCAISLQELQEALSDCNEEILLVGDGAALCHKALGYPAAPEHLVMQRASGVALAARQALLRGDSTDGAALNPNYLRLSQAERERNERLKQTQEA